MGPYLRPVQAAPDMKKAGSMRTRLFVAKMILVVFALILELIGRALFGCDVVTLGDQFRLHE